MDDGGWQRRGPPPPPSPGEPGGRNRGMSRQGSAMPGFGPAVQLHKTENRWQVGGPLAGRGAGRIGLGFLGRVGSASVPGTAWHFAGLCTRDACGRVGRVRAGPKRSCMHG